MTPRSMSRAAAAWPPSIENMARATVLVGQPSPATARAAAELARRRHVVGRARARRPIRSWPERHEVAVRLLDGDRVVGGDAGEARGRSMAALTRTTGSRARRAAGSARGRRRPGRSGRRRRSRRTPAAPAACRRSRPRTRRRAVRVHSTGVNPRWASAPPTTSANAGKIGFCSSGSTRPTSRARSPRSLVGRS